MTPEVQQIIDDGPVGPRLPTKLLGDILLMPDISNDVKDLIMEELDERKYDETTWPQEIGN